MKIRVKNDIGKCKEIKVGFSWTMLFFGVFVPLVRGDWKWFLILLGVNTVSTIIDLGFLYGMDLPLIIVGLTLIVPFLMLGLSFFYNRLYAKDLYDKGYRGLTPEENQELIKYITD